MSNAFAGVGTRFRRWNPTTTEWQDIAEVKTISGPGMSRDVIDVTSLDSTGGWREFIAGFRNAGTVVLNMNFTRATYDIMWDDFGDDDVQYYEMILSDPENTTIEFAGLVTELPVNVSADDAVTNDATIQISGVPVINSGASSGL
jgi:predicted secreted protein